MSERAMMSDANLGECARIYARAVGHQGASAEVIAMREAQRILAETEPESEGVALPPCQIRPFLPVGRRGALIDSLAAFLAAPDPAAYLAAVTR